MIHNKAIKPSSKLAKILESAERRFCKLLTTYDPLRLLETFGFDKYIGIVAGTPLKFPEPTWIIKVFSKDGKFIGVTWVTQSDICKKKIIIKDNQVAKTFKSFADK